jgi:peptidyl-prolyl isomerase G (cyclophilin G)
VRFNHCRLVPTTHALLADFTKRNGSGGESIYGAPFPDEDLTRPLDSEGCVYVHPPT